MGRPAKYKHNYASVTTIVGLFAGFNPTWWYKAKRMELLKLGEDLNQVDPIEVCNEIKLESQRIGHKVHKGIEQFLKGASVDEASEGLTDQQKIMLSQLIDWCTKKKPKPILMEEPLYSHAFKFAGTPDLVCTLNGGKTLTLVDWKTDAVPRDKSQDRERRGKYLWQIGGYCIAYEETHGRPIRKAYTIRASKDLQFAEYFFSKEEVQEGIREFKLLRELYKRVKGK